MANQNENSVLWLCELTSEDWAALPQQIGTLTLAVESDEFGHTFLAIMDGSLSFRCSHEGGHDLGHLLRTVHPLSLNITSAALVAFREVLDKAFEIWCV